MFFSFHGLRARRIPPHYERAFVESVRVPGTAPHTRRTERLLVLCWIVIGLKCAFVAWAVPHFHVPFSSLWVILPTLFLAGTATAIYLRRD
jgi:uncharacterized membrane protein YczE